MSALLRRRRATFPGLSPASNQGVCCIAVQARARDKARLCGQMAATARKIAAMTPAAKPAKAEKGAEHPLDLIQDFVRRMDKAATAAEAPPEPRAAQAVAMQAALAKLKRR